MGVKCFWHQYVRYFASGLVDKALSRCMAVWFLKRGGGGDCGYLSVTMTEVLEFVVPVEVFLERPPFFIYMKHCV